MDYMIHGRKPEAVFRFFEELCAIPHPSYHEERVADWLVTFARERGLWCYRDELHNVLIKKPATSGLEGRAPILFQGHTDMVCEKNSDVEHDFLRDPLKLFLDGDLLGARGTTLGGDDGIAVAMMLALLDGEITEHPALECLFTVSEEVGLNGAHGFDASQISARRMINLDSEDLGVVTAGCAGGLRSELTLPTGREPIAGEVLEIGISGLTGGHSGVDIHRGRANANKLMGRLLSSLRKTGDVRLVRLTGGSKDNAIPRECEAIVAVSEAKVAEELLRNAAEELVHEYRGIESNAIVRVTRVAGGMDMLSRADTDRAIAILSNVQNGVREMNASVAGLVEWSRNLGVVRTAEDGSEITFVFSSRSAWESRLDASIDELDALAAVTGCTTRHHSRYPGWTYAPQSPLRDAYLEAYRSVTGREARVDVIHAGLECGILYSKLPDMDIISIGPDMRDIHSPNERLDLSSVEIFWKTLEKVISYL